MGSLSAPQEVNNQTAAGLLLPRLLRPSGSLQPSPSSPHANKTHTPGNATKDRTVAVRLGPNLDEDTKATVVRGEGGCFEILIRCALLREETTTAHRFPLLFGTWGRAEGPLLIVRYNTTHFCLSSPRQIRTGNTGPVQRNQQRCVSWLHLHRAAHC